VSVSASADGPVPADDRPRWAVTLAWVVLGLEIAGLAFRVWLEVQNGKTSDLEGSAIEALLFLSFPAVGVVLATRRPRNPLGWLMLAIGYLFVNPGASYARYAAVTRGGSLPGAGLALAFEAPSWVPFIGLSGFLLLLFPDGHLPTPRWRWFARVCAVGLTSLFLLILFSPGQGTEYDLPQVSNPIGIAAFGEEGSLRWLLGLVAFAPIAVAGGAVGLIRRRRRTIDPVQRQQLRWLTWAAGVIAILYVAAFVPNLLGQSQESTWSGLLGGIAGISFALIPVTIGIAVLRYRLYDIDFVIRKTVVFTVLAAFIAVVYVVVVAGVGALVGSRSSPLLSALAAAVIALAFQPARARARRFADRVVFGRRATPYEVMTRFGDQLGGTYAATDVLARTARVLAEGVGAERAQVRLRVGDGFRTVASWPEADADDPPSNASDRVVDVRHQGEVLGALVVSMPPNDPLDPPREKLVRDLAAQAGLVLSNVRLTEDLKARLDDLGAAQRRLVSAQDEARRRLERNIHDGAQQQLVALAVKARLARTLTERDPPKAVEMLEQIEGETQAALDDLRDLARGIYPPLLADKGLEAALAAQARKSPVPVTVLGDHLGRFPQEIEAAVYFSSLEALQNTAKYADATSARIELHQTGGTLVFTVSDDGRGFDPGVAGTGSGLQGIADRLGALGGTLEVTSAPGAGTTVTGRLPVALTDAPAHREDASSIGSLVGEDRP
jgi:signal transduction histidine kinase